MTMQDLMWLLPLLAMFVGIEIGRALEAWKWRSNAKAIQRIESGGKLFKVSEA